MKTRWCLAILIAVCSLACLVAASESVLPAVTTPPHVSDTNPLGVVSISTQAWYVAPDKAEAREYMSPRNSRAQQMSIADIKIPPRGNVTRHRHIMEEVYYVVSGEGIMEINGVEQRLRKGDAVCILPNERHSIRNPAKKTTLRLTVTCTPPWRPELLIFD